MQGNALRICDTHTDMPPFVVDVVVGQLRCAGHVQPAQATIDTQATLVEMKGEYDIKSKRNKRRRK